MQLFPRGLKWVTTTASPSPQTWVALTWVDTPNSGTTSTEAHQSNVLAEHRCPTARQMQLLGHKTIQPAQLAPSDQPTIWRTKLEGSARCLPAENIPHIVVFFFFFNFLCKMPQKSQWPGYTPYLPHCKTAKEFLQQLCPTLYCDTSQGRDFLGNGNYSA